MPIESKLQSLFQCGCVLSLEKRKVIMVDIPKRLKGSHMEVAVSLFFSQREGPKVIDLKLLERRFLVNIRENVLPIRAVQ